MVSMSITSVVTPSVVQQLVLAISFRAIPFTASFSQVAAATNNVVQGNYIGLGSDGSTILGNQDGVILSSGADGNTIGGSVAGAGNVISGNNFGVNVQSANNTIAGNIIGLNAAGDAKRANSYGISISNAGSNTIGGTTTLARNIISGNTNSGIVIDGGSATNNLVQGN